MPYGFVIDQHRCIGCHACTVACKSENDVPVGDFRTWVKYTEVGTFPTVSRHFAVLRCNHCTNAPCVTICPVTALNKRDDGIVDLDKDVCIGCKACMQACPYDALHLNEATGGAEKCHYCAHRVDQGLEPACVVVCPEQAIISGDYDDPNSRIAQAKSQPDAKVRRPEQNTNPNVWYLGADDVSLNPGSAKEPSTYIWSERRQPAPDYPADIPLVPDATTVLDVNHKVHWGWKVSLYLLTKGLSAGAILLAPLVGAATTQNNLAPEIIGLVFLAITLLLLLADLKRPSKFFRMLLRPNTKSWLVKGSWGLTAFGGVAFLSLLAQYLEWSASTADTLRYVGIPLALAAAGYTAFLFYQCEGRDLWQNRPVLLLHLIAQAIMLGAAVLLPFFPAMQSLCWLMLGGAMLHLVFALKEAYGSHPTSNAKLAASLLPRIKIYKDSKLGAFGLGLTLSSITAILAPVLLQLQVLSPVSAGLLCAVCCLGIFFYEQAYVRAGQLPPLS